MQRYKKGPKLGAGGLIRAYGAAAREAVAAAEAAGAEPAFPRDLRFCRGSVHTCDVAFEAGVFVALFADTHTHTVHAGVLAENRRVAARLTVKARADKIGDLYRVLGNVERVGERHDGTFVEMDCVVYDDDVITAEDLAARVGDATAGAATVTETPS